MTTLLLVRHGQSEWNRQGRIQGQFDSPLTEFGRAQAKRIGVYLAGSLPREDVSSIAIFSSPMHRAQETAFIIADAIGCERQRVLVEPRLNDFDQGELSGSLGWDSVGINYPDLARLRLEDPLTYHPPGGESGFQFRDRLISFLDELDRSNQQGTRANVVHLLVSHGIVNKYIRSIRRNITGSGIIALDEGQDTVFRLDGDQESSFPVDD